MLDACAAVSQLPLPAIPSGWSAASTPSPSVQPSCMCDRVSVARWWVTFHSKVCVQWPTYHRFGFCTGCVVCIRQGRMDCTRTLHSLSHAGIPVKPAASLIFSLKGYLKLRNCMQRTQNGKYSLWLWTFFKTLPNDCRHVDLHLIHKTWAISDRSFLKVLSEKGLRKDFAEYVLILCKVFI